METTTPPQNMGGRDPNPSGLTPLTLDNNSREPLNISYHSNREKCLHLCITMDTDLDKTTHCFIPISLAQKILTVTNNNNIFA